MADSRLNNTEFMKTFLDLPKMFSHIKRLNRGELYKLLPTIVKNYNKDWSSTLDHNTYTDIRRFVSLLKVYNIKHDIPKIDKYERNRKFVAQMFSSIAKTTTIPAKVENTIEKVDDLVDKMHNVLDSSSDDIRKMFSNLNSFTSLFVPSSNYWTEIIAYITKFAAFGYLLSHEHNRSISNIVALLTLILPTGVGDCIISSLRRAIQGIWDRFKRGDDLVANAYEDDNTIVAFFKVTVHLMRSMFTHVPIEQFKDMQISVSKIKMVADYLKNSNTIFEYIMKLFQKTLEIVGNKLLKYYGKLPSFLQQENLNELIDKYVEIKENKLDVKANTNSYIAKQVLTVYNDALKAQAKLVKTTKRIDFNQSKLLAYLNIIIRNLEPIINKIPDHIKGTKNARRTKPFWLYIFGEPRIGKTAMYQPYIVNAIARCCGLIDKYQDYSEYTYFRNCGDEYWEKYCGQPVLWYNDLFQVFSNEQKVNIGIEEITNVVDDNLYPLNMAFEEKHNVYFDSQFVISNAQKDLVGQSFVSNKCLSGGEHMYSRRNMVVRLRIDSTYKSAGGLNYEAIDKAREMKQPFIGDLFPANMYLVDFMDPMSGMLLKTVSFSESVKIIVSAFDSYKKHQNNFKDKLFNHFEQMWAQTNDTWEDALYQAATHEIKCDQCVTIYNESNMLNEDERNEIRTILLLHCPHKEVKQVSRWKEFGELVKVNITAFWDTVRNFIKNNYIYLMISALLALLPMVFMLVNQYFNGSNIQTLSAEVNNIRGRKQVVRMQTQEYSQQNRDIENKVVRNMAMIYIKIKYDGQDKRIIMGSSLGVGGDIFCMPKHFFSRMEDFAKYYGIENITLELIFMGNQSYNIKFEDVIDLHVDFEHLTDIVFLQMPKLCCLAKLDRFFVNVRDEPVLYESYLYGRRVDNHTVVNTLPVSNVIMTTRAYTHPEMELPIIGKFIPARKIVLPEGYEFKVNGVTVGDCGMLLLNTDDKMNARKILGMHVAGSIKGNIGLASPVYAEDILCAYEKANIFISMDSVSFESIDKADSTLKYDIQTMFNVCGTMFKNDKKIKLSIPMKTSISKSVFFDLMLQDFGPNTQMPAKLRPYVIDGVKYSPMLKGLCKLTKSTNNISYSIIKHICDHMYASIMSWDSKYQAQVRVLSLDEAVNGLSDLNKIDITTSAGFPYQLDTRKGGKRDWLEVCDDKLIPTQQLIDNINVRLEAAKRNIISATYFVDTLKDELRPIAKVMDGKTRVFQVGPMCLSILMRQYFGYFIMHCQTTYINGEMGIGINPNSYDWTLLIRRLLRVGSYFINGDYSDYDASMSQPIMMHICDVINRFYGLPYEHEDNTVRRVLMATFLNNIHIVEDVVFMRLQGNMSGIALTTIVNCLFNMFLLRYAYFTLVSNDFIYFNTHVSATFYGDDNLVSVSNDITDKFNMLTYCQVMADLGIIYTTPDKTNMNKTLYTVDEISYLKRKFSKRANIYYAQLDMDTIMEIPRWSESDPNNMLDQINRFNCVLYELVNYGYEKYQNVYNIFSQYILYAKQHGYNIQITQLLSYNYILRSMFPQFFSCDLVKCIDQHNDMLKESGSKQSVKIGSNCLSNGSDTNFYLPTANTENETQTQSAEGSVQRAHVQVTRQMVAQNYDLRDLMDDIQFPIDFSKEFIAMSTDTVLQSREENAGETIRRAQVTTTFDDTIPHLADNSEILNPLNINPFLHVDLPSFINREWYIAQIEWSSTYSRTSLTKLLEFPEKLWTYIVGKIQNVAFWAPDFDIIFKVNGTPMHYGRFMFSIVPSADILADAYLQPQNMSHYRFAQISPTGNQSVVLKVPYLHYYDRISIAKEQSTVPWTLYGFPMVPLTSANTDTPAPVTISIYIRITNPRFSGYTNATAVLTDELVTQSSEQEELSKQENVTSKIQQTGIVSFANTVARKVTTLAGDMSQLAVDAGFSNAPNLTATKPVIFRYTSLNKCEDLPLTTVLGPSQNAQVAKSDAFANGIPDGMKISKVAGRMVLEQVLKITSLTDVNNNVMVMALNPCNFYFADYELTDTANTFYPHPAHYLTRLHKYWRGSIKLHFSFVCSAFHSLRVRFSYVPKGFSPLVAPNASTGAYNVNEVWDINNQTDYSVRIPFHTISEFLASSATLGSVYITQLTKLTSVMDTPQPIYLQVWIGMDDDFQLAYPYIPSAGSEILNVGTKIYMSNPDIGTWATVEETTKTTEVEMISQSNDAFSSGNPLLNYRNMQFPSMSSEGLENLVYPTLGGIEEKHKTYKYSTSYEIASVKELCNMLTPIERTIVKIKDAVTTATFANAGRKLIPFAWMDRGANDTVWFNYLYQIMAIFRYAKGSVRFVALTDRGISATANLSDYTAAFNGNFFQDYTTDVFFDSGSLAEITSGSHLFKNLESQPADIVIPYYSNTKCVPMTYHKSTYPSISNPPYLSQGSLLIRIPVPASSAAGTEIAKIVWLVAGGDDLQLGYQIAVPRCRYGKAS